MESYNTALLLFIHQLLARVAINFVGNLNSMEIKQKIDNLLKQKKEIDKQISQLEYELVQKEQANFIQLVGQYIKKYTDAYTVKMYVKKARLFNGTYQLLGPAIRNYPCGDCDLSSKYFIFVESDLSNIEIISKDEWDASIHNIYEMVENTITNNRT